MPGLDEPRLVVGRLPGGEQAVDAVSGVAEDLLDAPLPQPLQDVVGDGLAHRVLLGRCETGGYGVA